MAKLLNEWHGLVRKMGACAGLFLILPLSGLPAKESGKLDRYGMAVKERFGERYKSSLGKSLRPVKEPRRDFEPKIIGGEESESGDWPWMVALMNADVPESYFSQFCGGSVIHPYWIVTAGHCVFGKEPAELDVLVGGHDLMDDAAGQRISVAEIIIHPGYNDYTTVFDIALLRLAEPVDEAFQPIELVASIEEAPPTTLSTVIGWGLLEEEGDKAEILQEVELPIVETEVANQLPVYAGTLVDEIMLIAGVAEGGKDSCNGDSGGPLMVQDATTGNWLLAGITSFGRGCAMPDTYGVYTRVSFFRQFILNHMQPEYVTWEASTGAIGARKDHDLDGRDNFTEFLLNGDPWNPADPPALSFRHVPGAQPSLLYAGRTNAEGADIFLDSSTTPNGPWGIDTMVLRETDAQMPDGRPAVEISLQDIGTTPASFYRVRGNPTHNLLSATRTFLAYGWCVGTLTPEDARHPEHPDKIVKLYQLEAFYPGYAIALTGRSETFDMQLELLDAETGLVLVKADGDGAAGVEGTDEILTFVPEIDRDYLIRVTTETGGQTGSYSLSGHSPDYLNSIPAIGSFGQLSGTLSENDFFDPVWLPEPFFADDILIVSTDRERILFQLQSSDFDAFIEIIDGETNHLIKYDDDGGGGLDARLVFETQPGHVYILRVTSAVSQSTGEYFLTTSIAEPLPEISVPEVVTGQLETSDEEDPVYVGTYIDDYVVTGVTPGQSVYVRLSSYDFDAYLFLVDGDSGEILDENDDFGMTSTDSSLRFTVEEGRRYRLRVSSLLADETGEYTLTTR